MAQKDIEETPDNLKDESGATGVLGEGGLPDKFNSASPKKIGA